MSMKSSILVCYIPLIYFILLKQVPTASSSYASLAVSADISQKPLFVDADFCVLYNPSYAPIPTASLPDATRFHAAFYPEEDDPLGCTKLPPGTPEGISVVFDRGNCTFYTKALEAQKVNASMVVIVYNETILDSVPSLVPGDKSSPPITIPVVFISNSSGEDLKNRLNTSTVYLSVYIPPSLLIDPGSVLLFSIAVGTVLIASLLANTPLQFLRYGLLLGKGTRRQAPSGSEDNLNKKMSVTMTLVGLTCMVVAICALLTLLYFFYNPMVYIVLALYSIASVFGLYNLLSPFVALIPLGDKCRLPPNKIPILQYRPNPLFFATVFFSVCFVVWWVVERHSGYAWILQDILGFAFITMLLSRLKFLKVWVVSSLLVILFFYDIFMVFITPYFTSDGVSVMEKAATGPQGSSSELLPVVFLVPKFVYPSKLEALCSDYIKTRPTSLLGYGDVGIPGLLVTLCLRFDLLFRKGNCFKIYYATSGIAYFIGLVITYVALGIMKSAQPALLYLVPTTLGSVLILSLLRREFKLFFTGSKSGSLSDGSHSNDSINEPKGAESTTTTTTTTSMPVAVESECDSGNENQVVHNETEALISDHDSN